MQYLVSLGIIAFAATLKAGEVDAKRIRLIGADATIVFGMDVERYRNSALHKIFPLQVDDEHASQVIVCVTGGLDRGKELKIVRRKAGSVALPHEQSEGTTVSTHRGITVVTRESSAEAQLDMLTTVSGEPAVVAGAIDRWVDTADANDLAPKILRLSAQYDNWFIAIKPLADVPVDPSQIGRKHLRQIVEAIEEVSGGIRVGQVSDFAIDVALRTAEDASALAALGHWLPGLVQMKQTGPIGAIADLIENFDTRASGALVSLSFTLREDAVLALLRKWEERVDQ